MPALHPIVRTVLTFALVVLPGGHPAAAATSPKLSLKASPSVGTSSTVFVFRARLEGGEDSEDLYCLTAEWIWEEQADSSLNETECPPYEAGVSVIERTFMEEQSFRRTGSHRVKLILRKGENVIASTGTAVTIRPTR